MSAYIIELLCNLHKLVSDKHHFKFLYNFRLLTLVHLNSLYNYIVITNYQGIQLNSKFTYIFYIFGYILIGKLYNTKWRNSEKQYTVYPV